LRTPATLWGGQIVDHDHVALGQGWNQHFLDVDEEGLAVHRPIQDEGRDKPIKAQSDGEGRGLPMAEGRLADQPLSLCASPANANHLGRDSGLVDEHQLAGIKSCLTGLEALPGIGHVGTILFGRVQCFMEWPSPPSGDVGSPET
jgi:hypothetical protein